MELFDRIDEAARIDETCRRLASSQRTWAAASPKERARALARVRHELVDRQDEIVRAIAMETGKPVTEALAQEVSAALGMMRFLENHYPRWLKVRRYRWLRPGFWSKQNEIHFDPLGLIAVIGPSNFPFSLVVMQACSALLCGNAVVVKPSERCPETTRLAAELFQSSVGVSEVIAVIAGDAETARRLIAHPSVSKVLFTGSTRAGEEVAALCGASFKPCVLELGGRGTAIVCADADLSLAARGIVWSTLYTGGQSCIGTRKVLVPAVIEQDLRDALRLEVSQIEVGLADDPNTDVTSEPDLKKALEVVQVEDLDEAIEQVNRSHTGLSASIWTRDLKRAASIARRLQTGMVWVNDCSAALPQFPWGGNRRSGWGRLFAREALTELTALKSVSVDHRRSARPKEWWFPYSLAKYEMLASLNRQLYGRARWSKLGRTLKAALRFLQKRIRASR
jgi:acyl-CoA reductase-like NAD-dependent aldehyde dehydrogenase